MNSSTFDLYQKTEGGWIKVGNIQGAQGEDGTDDKDSLSAYEIWLQAGHVGTEEDFLNWLKEGGETTSSETSFLQYYLLDDGTLAVGAGRSQLLSEIEIPAAYQGRAVTRIAYEGFANCINLQAITIPNSVTVIEESAFNGCESLASIAIPDSVTKIGLQAFNFCQNLTSVTFGEDNNLAAIGEGAFSGNNSLASVVIPASVTEIGFAAFDLVSGISVYYGGTQEQWSKIDIAQFNDAFANATRYYYSESAPSAAGNFWHYADGKVVVWSV